MKPARGFVTPLVIILVLALIALAGAFLWQYKFSAQKAIPQSITPSTSSQAPQATQSQTVKPTIEWKTFNYKGIISFEYPSTYVTRECSSYFPDDKYVFLAPTKTLLGACQSDGVGLIYIYLSPITELKASYSKDTLLTEEGISVGGKPASKFIGPMAEQKPPPEQSVPGTKRIIYLVNLGKNTLEIGYYQGIDESDYTSDFQHMISSIKFIQ